MMQDLTDDLNANQAQFGKLMEYQKILDATQKQLTGLTMLGDLVGPEDVIKAAGELVGAGASPAALAKMLSTLPQDGPALQVWLGDKSAELAKQQAMLAPIVNIHQHELGMAGMRWLTAHSMGAPTGKMQQQGGVPAPPNNAGEAPAQSMPQNPLAGA